MFLEGIDQGALFFFEGLQRPWLTPTLVVVSDLGSRNVLFPLAVAGTVVLTLKRQLRTAAIFALIALGAYLLGDQCKDLVARQRPNRPKPAVVVPTSGSFPSGHALNSTTILVSLALLLSRGWRPAYRRGIIALAVLLAFAIGFTRLYLMVHFVTDVVAGWMLGAVFVMLCNAWTSPALEPVPLGERRYGQ